MHHLLSVPSITPVANMDKRRVNIQLVEPAAFNKDSRHLIQPVAVTGDGLDVSRFAAHVLAVGTAAYQSVELGAAVAAADTDGVPVGLTQGVENVLDEGNQILFGFFWGTVPEVVFQGGVAS